MHCNYDFTKAVVRISKIESTIYLAEYLVLVIFADLFILKKVLLQLQLFALLQFSHQGGTHL